MNKNLEDIISKPCPDFNQLRKVLLREGIPEYVPFYELFVNVPVMESILGKKIPKMSSTVEFYYKAGYDYVPAWPHFKMKLGNPADISSNYPIKDWRSFEGYKWPDPKTFEYTEFEELLPILPEGMKIIGQTGGPFEMLEMLTGYTDLCYLLYDDPGLITEIIRKISVIYTSLYESMASIDQVGAIVISDDMGFKTQTLIHADQLRKLILPLHKKLVDIIHNAGKPCILHSCGQIYSLMDDIINDVKIDAKHSFEDQIFPVEQASEKYGQRIAILGGLDVDMLCRANKKEIKNRTLDLVMKLGTKGGYALGSGNSIPDYVPVENYLAMLDQGWKVRNNKY